MVNNSDTIASPKDCSRPLSVCKILNEQWSDYFIKRRSLDINGLVYKKMNKIVDSNRPRSLPIINMAFPAIDTPRSSSDETLPLKRRQFSRRGFRSKRKKSTPDTVTSTTHPVTSIEDSSTGNSTTSIEIDHHPLSSASHPSIVVNNADLSPAISVTSIPPDHFSLDSGNTHKNNSPKPHRSVPPFIRRSFETLASKRKLTVSYSAPATSSSFRLKDRYLPSLDKITSASMDFKYLEPKRGGSIRRSLRSTFGSFKKLSNKHKSVSVSGFVIQDRYLNCSAWKRLSSLEPKEIKKRLPSQDKVFEHCPRIIRQNDIVRGSFHDQRSLGLFLRPYTSYLVDEQYCVRLNFIERHFHLYHELYEADTKNVITCNVGLVSDVTSVLGSDVTIPMLTVCTHVECAMSALQYTCCPGV